MHIPNVGLIVACPSPRRGRGQSDRRDYLQQESRKGKHAMTRDKKTQIKTMIKIDFCAGGESSITEWCDSY